MVGALTSWTIIGLMQEAMPGTPGWLILLISLLVAFVVCGVAKISMDEAFKGVLPFLLAQLAVLFLLVLFPSIVTVPLQWMMR